MKEFLVELAVEIPEGAAPAEVDERRRREAVAAAALAAEGRLVRLWLRPLVGDGTTAIGLYRAESVAELDELLAALPLGDWLRTSVTVLEPHPNDPQARA